MRRLPGLATTMSSPKLMPEACASRCRTVDPGGPAGSSSETSPLCTATSTVNALSGLVTEAHGSGTSGPVVASVPVRSTTATATVSTGQVLTISSGSATPVTLSVAGRAARTQDARRAPIPRPPAAGVPVPAVGQVAAPVGGPDHDVRDARGDLLVTARAAVRLGRRAAGHVAHHPVPVAAGLHRLDATAGAPPVRPRPRRPPPAPP